MIVRSPLQTIAILCILLIAVVLVFAAPRAFSAGIPDTYPRTTLPISLLGTINRTTNPTAMVKNNRTGAVKSYIKGDLLDIMDGEQVGVLDVGKCSMLLDRGGIIESLACSVTFTSGAVGAAFEAPMDTPLVVNRGFSSPLSRFKIMGKDAKPRKRYAIVGGTKKKPLVFKSSFDTEIKKTSRKHGVDPYLVKAIIKAESDFNPEAVSPKNAQGIMQLMPGTASDYGVDDPFDPAQNIEGGVRVLRDLLDYFYGNKRLAVAAYNAGKGAVLKHGNNVPPYRETRQYVDRVLSYYSQVHFD